MNAEVVETLSNRANYGIDPHIHIWGWEIPGYLFLGGIVAGIMVLLSLREITSGSRPESRALRVMPFVAVALLSLGMFFLFLDLAYPLHVLRFYATFEPTSPMSWGSWLLIVVYPVLVLQGLGALDAAEREWLGGKLPGPLAGLLSALAGLADRWRRGVLWTSATFGAGLGVYTGLLLGTMVARPMWNTSVLGPLFLVSGISTGAALMMLFRVTHAEARSLARLDSVAIVLELILIAALVLGYATGDTASIAAGSALLGGPFTPAFWGLVVVAGLVVPLGLNVFELKRDVPGTFFTPMLVLIGGLALRAVFVSAGQLSSYGHLAMH